MIVRRTARYIRNAVRRAPDVIAALLIRFLPSIIKSVCRMKSESFWYKTTTSTNQQTVWAYVSKHSVYPGDIVNVMISGGPSRSNNVGHFDLYRIGHYDNSDRELVWRSGRLEIQSHRMNNSAAAIGPAWPIAFTIATELDWLSGYYSLNFVPDVGPEECEVAFIVVKNREARGDILVKLSTATYQAYNKWGGHNCYRWETPNAYEGSGLGVFELDTDMNRGDIVSFDRPTASEFWEWEYYFVLWIEQLASEHSLSVHYTTNHDLSQDACAADKYQLLVSVGHDEYWSREEFDLFYERIFRKAGNTLFLGANTAYWQVRYVDVNSRSNENGRQMICYKTLDDPFRYSQESNTNLDVTARFRDGNRRPESMLMGVAYQSNFHYRRQIEPSFSYRICDTSFPFFSQTGYQIGDTISGVVGHEWDCRDPEVEFSCPGEQPAGGVDRLWDPNLSNIEVLPKNSIRVVCRGDPVDLRGYQGTAEAVYFESSAGAKVFSSGTNRWVWGLGKRGYEQKEFKTLNENIVLHMLEGHLKTS